MLIKVGDVIFNTDRIIIAEMDDKSRQAVLRLRLAGGGHDRFTCSFETFYGKTAQKVWSFLQDQATHVTDEIEEQADDSQENYRVIT